MRDNLSHEPTRPVRSQGQAPVGWNPPREKIQMRSRWWVVPGVAIISTMATVSAAQASMNVGNVTLPGSVQVAAPTAAKSATRPPPSRTPIGDEEVVPTSRTVVIESDAPTADTSTTRPTTQSQSNSGSTSSTLNPVPPSRSGSGAAPSPESGDNPTSPWAGSSESSSDGPTSTRASASTTTTSSPTRPTTGSTIKSTKPTEPTEPDGP